MTVAEFSLPQKEPTDTSTPARWVFSHAVRHWWVALMLFGGAFSNAALAAAAPIFIGQAFNLIQSDSSNLDGLLRIAFLIAGSQLIRGVVQFARNFGAELLAQRLERDIRDELYLSLLGKSMTFHNLQSVGDTMARATNDVREINLMFSPGFNLVIGSANFLIMPILIAPSLHPALLLTPALFLLLYGLALWHYLWELQPITASVRSSFGDLNARLAETLDGIEIVKGHAQEREEVSRFATNARGYRNAFVHQGDVEARYLPLLLLGLAMGGGFLHALLLFEQGAINLGQVVTYMGLLELLGFPTFISLRAYSQVSLGFASARRILELMGRKAELDQNPGGYQGEIRGEIEFREVDYGYPGEEAVLRGVSFHVQPGQTVAIVGQTGSGKTTLAKLINRTYDVSSGEILIDGIDLRHWNLESLRRQISIIEQDVFLFTRSIGENVAFGCPEATKAEIRAAAKDAQAHEFIQTFQRGYDTEVGERGVTLSGGQRQRIALARAFLTDPPILILDDATSSIDSATEDKIQRAIFKAAEGRTTLIITHRLSQIRWADLIIVLRKGRVVAMGSHQDLMETSLSYRRIFVSLEEA